MNVICIEEKAFDNLLDRMFKYVQSQMDMNTSDKWIDKKEAKRLLRIKSDTTLQKMRDEGQIRYSQPQRKHILYDRDSINEYLEAHAKEPFTDY
ncbi:helix-turn-helix domain-containing protein [Maribacter halichondriae]|uniref:helix-turn-helix domain-containing protein n=1 Tax=Maribacter halichondriae TaxID=2980554 RepID=UPI00235936C7|nr:helix-turn-helix domain-containing protein [Maribacter sp. Hal144]